MNSAGVLIFLIALVAGVIFLSQLPKTAPFFRFLPVPLWCYFIPTVLSSLGLLPRQSDLYAALGRFLLPGCLILLLIGTHLPSLFRLSGQALLAMAGGSLGILLGGALVYAFLWNGDPEFWKGWACLSGSWTGGSANMIALREILQAPESLFSNLILVDTIVAYSWMAFLIFGSRFQEPLDRWLGAEGRIPESSPPETESVDRKVAGAGAYLALAAGGLALGQACGFLGSRGPVWGSVANGFTWTILLATAVPLALSLTRARRLEDWGASRVGNFLLYLLLTSIGARADLAALTHAPLLILGGLAWVAVHGLVLLGVGKLFRIPSAILAGASQANVGGTVSAPLVAGVYNPALAPVGLLLAVLGNIYGTAFGLLFGAVCRRLSVLL